MHPRRFKLRPSEARPTNRRIQSNWKSGTNVSDGGLGLLVDVTTQGHVAEVIGEGLGLIAEHVHEHLAQITSLHAVAALVGQDPGEGADRVALGAGGIGLFTGQVGIQNDAVEGRGAALEARLHEPAGLVLEGSGLENTLDEGLVDIANRTRGVGEHTGDAVIALAAHAYGPVHRLANAEFGLEGGREGGEGIGEGKGGAAAVGTVGHGDLASTALELFPVGDGSEEHIGNLLLGQLQITTGLVVGDGDGATHGRKLHHTALHLGGLGAGDRLITGGKVDGASNELADAGAGTHGLIVGFRTTTCGQISEPTLIDGGREGGSRRVEVGASAGCGTASDGSQGCQGQGLLREGHGFGLL